MKQGAVVSTPYNTINFIRTMEEVLGLKQFLNLNDALGHPMADVFTTTPQAWSFTASPSNYLYATQLPLPTAQAGMTIPKSTHNAAYWARVTRGLDLSDADRVDPLVYNRILWKSGKNGLMGIQSGDAVQRFPAHCGLALLVDPDFAPPDALAGIPLHLEVENAPLVHLLDWIARQAHGVYRQEGGASFWLTTPWAG